MWHLTRIAGNKKVGPIPVTTHGKQTCPDSCIVKGRGCYADNYPLNTHWSRVTKGERGTGFDDYIKAIRSLPFGTLMRGQQAGDLPGNGIDTLDRDMCIRLAKAMVYKRKVAWTYTAYLLRKNLEVLKTMLATGYVVNKSCYTLDEVDESMDENVPATMVWKSTFKGRKQVTPKGRMVVGCPAQLHKDVTCSSCGGSKGPLCARIDRKFAVGFYAHGPKAKTVDQVLSEYRGEE